MQTSNVLVFIDSHVDDYQYLIDNVIDGAQIFLLHPDRDGVIEITEILQQYSNFEAVHIVSHGSSGSMRLGNVELNINNLNYYTSFLETWSSSASFYIYGCEVAAGEVGNNFLLQLQLLTQANIAASANPTGNKALGGDWNFELNLGNVIPSEIFSVEAKQSYSFVLGADDTLIGLWYGNNQQFGNLAIPQTWVNILGNISDPDGIDSLTYSLNGNSSVPLSIGPQLRLERPGDFNIDLAFSDLDASPVDDEIIITAVDNLGNITTDSVLIDYESGNTLQQPYTIDWSSVTNIQDVAQVVDGNWDIEGDTVRTTEPGYDRIIAVGDVGWDNYEVTTPVTINSLPTSDTPFGYGVGFIAGWTGHTDNPIPNRQPKSGFLPVGIFAWYFNDGTSVGERLELSGTGVGGVRPNPPVTLQQGITYNFKLKVETVDTDEVLYSFKVWEVGQTEPSSWDVEGINSGVTKGSLALLAHEYDVSFGDVSVVPIEGGNPPGNQAPVANDDSASVAPAETVEIDVLSNDSDSDGTIEVESVNIVTQPVNGTVSVENGIVSYTHDGSATTSDSLSYTVDDDDGDSSNTATVELTIGEPEEPSGLAFESDDFDSASLDSRWTVIDPLGDSSQGITGAGTGDALLELSVPGGTAHDLFNGNKNAVRAMQSASDSDFELEVKYDSEPDQRFELQGILVEQDSDDWIRFDTYHDGNNLRVFAATTTNGSTQSRINNRISAGDGKFLRINRQGDAWTLEYSADGSNWTTTGSFTQDLNVSEVGTFAGNSGGSPAFTSEVDYFFNSAAPIIPEI